MQDIALSDPAVEQVRAFNRFYTQHIGVLEPYLGSDLSLTQVRLLYELAQATGAAQALTARQLCQQLGMDAGYVSRELRKFEAKGWLYKQAHSHDGRSQALGLTAAGIAAFVPLLQRSQAQAAQWLQQLPVAQRGRLLRAMQEIQASVGAVGPANGHALQTVLLREPKPGDIGWVIQQHGEIYANEYGWNWEFEALVAGICAGLVKNFQPQSERGWIAELNGQRVGSVFVVKKNATTAQLRMLILTPDARGLGLGKRLTEEAIVFARSRGYKKMRLWTNACLLSARFIYESLGFRLTKSEPYQGFGHDLVSETWELRL